MKLLVATNNPGKVREYQIILANLLPGVELLTLREAGISHEVEETGATFEENARLKAREYAALAGLPVVADDSGLEVEALGGFPGVRSARWAGPSDSDRLHALLERMRDIAPGGRGARFVCVTCFRLPDGTERLARGELEGEIALAPGGEGGFGYDPIFRLPDGRTLAQLSKDEKNTISHRGRAAQRLAPQMAALLAGSAPE